MSYYSDIFSITIQGDKDGIIRMLNAAIRNVGSGNVISENDDVETMLLKLKAEDGKHLLCVSVLDLMDEDCLKDKLIQEKKTAFEEKMKYYQDVRDGKVLFESPEDENDAMYEADEALENMIDGRIIDIINVFMNGDGSAEVMMEYYVAEELFSYTSSDWAGWDDVCRLYGCQVVIDDDEYLNEGFHKFCGTTIYGVEDGTVEKTIVEPKLDIQDYIRAMDALVKMDSLRYRERKIKDMEVKIAELQAELSDEKLLVALENLHETDGNLQVPDGVTRISEVTWKYGEDIKSIYIPASVSSINKHSISSSNIETIEISPDNPYFCSVNNCILNKEKTVLFIGCRGSVIPEGITEIEDSAFSGCRGLVEVRIPSNVTRIGMNAFRSCSGLKKITFENGLKDLGIYAFIECTSLASVVLPETLDHLPLKCFSGCTSLKDVTLPEHLKVSDNEAFENTPYGGGVEERKNPELPF